MTLEQFNTLKIGDFIWYAINSGTTGISKYQYVGIFTDHATNETQHVFLSPYFVSTCTLLYGNEGNSRRLKDIFLTEQEAKDRVREESFLY
jgi:hypothetical protein